MNADQNNQGPYQGYANYQAPRRSYSAQDLGYAHGTGGLLRSPLIATAALLVGASILAGIIIMATPSDKGDEVLPIIKANNEGFKHTPEQRGGMSIPNKDSSVFDHMQDTIPQAKTKPEEAASLSAGQKQSNAKIENLLTAAKPVQTESETITKDEAPKIVAKDTTEKPAEKTEAKAEPTPQDTQETKPSLIEDAAAPSSVDLVKPEPSTPSKSPVPPSVKKPDRLHPAGSSPETLAFVRSVLQKNIPDETQQSSTIKPAVKAPVVQGTNQTQKPKSPVKPAPVKTPAANSAPLTHYIQLSSIKDESRAVAQWQSLKSKYGSVLSGSSYRVQRKDLGAKGIYYRIQAGPFTKADANAKCAQIKQQTPAGCYSVAQ